MKRRCVSIYEETDRILRARAAEVGNLSQAFRELVDEDVGNHQRLRHALRGAVAAARFNARLLRQHFGKAGSMRFLEEIELTHQEMEAKLAAPAALQTSAG